MSTRLYVLATCVQLLLPLNTPAEDGFSGPLRLSVSSNGVKTVSWPRLLVPALETNLLSSGLNPGALTPVPQDRIGVAPNGYVVSTTNALSAQFFGLTLSQKSSNALLTANALNRLAYGPTPDDLERAATLGPQSFIDEQLQPENIPNPIDSYILRVTNAVNLPTTPNWMSVTVTGLVSGASASGISTFYVYLTGVGEAFVDDVRLSVVFTNYTRVTNAIVNTNTMTTNFVVTNIVSGTFLGPNVISNGDFELPLANGWRKSANFTGSDVVVDPVKPGHCLHIIATAAGSGNGNAITQTNVPGMTNGNRCVLTFSCLPRPSSDTSRVNVRLSGSGCISSDANPPPPPSWIYVTATGQAAATARLYLYLDGAGEVYLDELKLVSGSVAEAGPNLLRNGDFEQLLTAGDWQATANFTNTVLSNTRSYAGGGSLRLIATAAGAGSGNALFQDNVTGVTNNGIYTVSFWCTTPTRGRTLTVRLSGSLLVATAPPGNLASLKRRFDTVRTPSPDTGRFTVSDLGGGTLTDLKAWFVLNAVGSPRQLLEVLSQFFENHFVTEHAKSSDYFDRFYNDGNLMDKLAADWEYREMSKWRAALLNPNCTFYDLLKISAESPAMIVYLDSVNSKGNGASIANENYAREILELFCMGVDNGYDQLDITAMSRAWTGWSVELVDPVNIDNPHAAQSRTYGFYPGNGTAAVSNLVGVWTFNYKSANHGTNRAPIFSVWSTNATRTNLVFTGPKRYAARLGAPWAGQPYQMVIPSRTGDSSLQDGYDVITHLANNIYTAEYISVKLCRLFVHDGFPNPTTTTNLGEYGFYDYTNPNRSPEAELVRQCIVAWDTPGPDGRQGNLRLVLRAIFNSDLFRGHGGSMQKVKTPLEYTVSAIRALRSANPDGTFTARTDGYSISGRGGSAYPLVRMGNLQLFNRDSPDGYPEASDPWVSAGTLAERIRFVQTMLMAVGDTNRNDGITGGNNNVADPVALLKKKLPAGSWNSAGDVVDYFLGILFPGEGAANLDLYRLAAIDFLNTSDNGQSASAFSGLGNATPAYDTRIRAMVSSLMSLQRFQEQ